MKRILAKLTYANVMATVAVFIALGGASYAALKLPKNSVGAKQLKKGAVTPLKLSAKSRLTLRGSQGPQGATGSRGPDGPRGPEGPRGSEGPQGAPGAAKVVVRKHSYGPIPAESFFVGYADCAPGEVATGGGAVLAETGGHEVLEDSFPSGGTEQNRTSVGTGDTPTGWGAIIRNTRSTPVSAADFYVICASP